MIIDTIVIANQMRYSRQADMGLTNDAIVMFPVPEWQKAISTFNSEISRTSGVEKVTFCSNAPASPEWTSVTVRSDSHTENEDFDISA